jgi:hypothetical protein
LANSYETKANSIWASYSARASAATFYSALNNSFSYANSAWWAIIVFNSSVPDKQASSLSF